MESMEVSELVLTGIVTFVKWMVYTGLLWGMIRVQNLNYNVAGLFASSLAATLVAMVPFVGGYLAYAVIVLCLWKCTGAEIVPDVIFTVCIAGALMFCFNLFAVGAVMGKLRPDLASDTQSEELWDGFVDASDDDGSSDDKEKTRPVANKTADRSGEPHGLVHKGVTVNTARHSAMIFDGKRTQTVFAKEAFAADFRNGRARFTCEHITRHGVVLATADGEHLLLHLKPAPGTEASH